MIRLGIDLDSARDRNDGRPRRAAARCSACPDDAFVVGWIGRMTAIKRVAGRARSRSASCATAASTRRSASSATAPTARPSSERAHELGIARARCFVGYQRDVAPYYAFFDALLLPSANEGTPVVAIESLAARRPVVATRVGGVPDVVSDGEDGFLVEPGDVERDRGRARAARARPGAARAAWASAGRERVIPRYRVERLVDDVDALYRELLSDAEAAAAIRMNAA